MDHLPFEIIEKILCNAGLSLEDYSNFSLVCSHFKNVVYNSNALWKFYLFERWPKLRRILENKPTNFVNESRYIFDLRRRTRDLLEKMSWKFYEECDISEETMKEWQDLLEEKDETYHYLVIDLMEILDCNVPILSIETVPFNTPGNKTRQFYSRKVLRYIREKHLSKKWNEFVKLPEEEQVLEFCAVLVAQWCQPFIDVDFEEISEELDRIAMKIKDTVRINFPDHPLLLASQEELNHWKTHNITDHQFDQHHTEQLIHLTREIFSKDLDFQGDQSNYHSDQNSYIDKVLLTKRGLPITLSIIFEAVARRLGIHLNPLSLPMHFSILYRQDDNNSFLIDVFNDCELIKCDYKINMMSKANEIVERMVRNLNLAIKMDDFEIDGVSKLESLQKLMILVSLDNFSSMPEVISVKPNMFQRKMNLLFPEAYSEETDRLAGTCTSDQDNFSALIPVRMTERKPDLKYAVGMVMKHVMSDYKCVIYGWQMDTSRGCQPFYDVLAEDGSHKYVAQEHLIPTSDQGIIHLQGDIGNYFSHFFETHYVPNFQKEQEYPSDKKIRHFYHQKLKLESYNI